MFKVFCSNKSSSNYNLLLDKLYIVPTDRTQLHQSYNQFWSQQELWCSRLNVVSIEVWQGQNIVAHALVQHDHIKRVTYIGWVELVNDRTVAARLVEAINSVIIEHHYSGSVFIPVNGSIWQKYRWRTEGPRESLFDLPEQPYYDELLSPYFQQEQFFSSFLMTDLSFRYKTGSLGPNLKLMPFDYGAESIRQLYDFTTVSFDDIAHHSILSEPEFATEYAYLENIPNDYLLLLVDEQNCWQAMLFGVLLGEELLIKTVATRPNVRQRGLAGHLFNEALQRAVQAGAKRAKLMYVADERLVRQILPPNSRQINKYKLLNT